MRYGWLFALAACGAGHGGHGDAGGGGGGGDAADAGPPIMTPTVCTVPTGGMLADTTGATVVGTGTSASCSEAALATAVATGGPITFDCGAAPVTITLTAPLVINNVAGTAMLGDTVIDGGGMVTLSGGGTNRIITLDACTAPFNSPHCDSFPHPALTVQRLTFADGFDNSTDGGGAIYRRGGALTVIDSTFVRNTCATTGQDTAGGALRLIYATPALVVGSTFGGGSDGNKCSNGGAIGSLQASPVQIINSVIDGNHATGNGGNPGNGGNGAGIYHDGVGLDLELCGVQVTNNSGDAYGGGMFFVDDAGQGIVKLTNTTIANNAIPVVSGMPSHGGAGYIQGAVTTVANVTIDANAAGFASGLYVNTMSGQGSFEATNLTVTGHAGDGLTFDGGIAGTLLNSTIANNNRGISGAAPFTLINTLIAGNVTSCDAAVTDGTGNLEFPDASCGSIATSDPMLSPLADNATTTGVQTLAVSATSPALGLGNACPATDARGMARPANGCTSGAYQAP